MRVGSDQRSRTPAEQVWPAVEFLTTPVHSFLGDAANAALALPVLVQCLFTLAVSLSLVCEGVRAADKLIGGRVALAGVAGAVGTLAYRYGQAEGHLQKHKGALPGVARVVSSSAR